MDAEKCTCGDGSKSESDSGSASESPSVSSSTSSSTKEKRKISFTSLGLQLRRGRSLHFNKGNGGKRSKKSPEAPAATTTKKSPKWGIKFNCTKKESKGGRVADQQQQQQKGDCCRCTCYRRTDEERRLGAISNQQEDEDSSKRAGVEEEAASTETRHDSEVARIQDEPVIVNNDAASSGGGIYGNNNGPAIILNAPFFDIQWMRTVHEDCDEAARRQRAKEIERGVDPPADFYSRATRRVQLLCSDVESENGGAAPPRRLQLVCPSDLSVDSLRALFQNHVTVRSCPLDAAAVVGCHTQVDFVHCLVPDLLDITNCTFYWGKMDRYEAERLLDGKPEGTFLLRDSAQEEFLFSVSFRKYSRSLHARIEQWNHKFSFDSHDPGVYTSTTVCGLIEHYKDPSSCMFFEPMLTRPLHRNFAFSLQHLCRAVIAKRLTYDDVNQLRLPKALKGYLKEYHYRQKVRVERFDDDVQWLDLRNVPP